VTEAITRYDAGRSDEARALFERVLANVEQMLRRYMIHADLSAHNILWWDGEIRLIDWPQAVQADQHPGAFELLARDVTRVCQYFARQGVESDPIGLATDLWRRLQSGEL
jgi:serine/threonine-protein kinase RIO1